MPILSCSFHHFHLPLLLSVCFFIEPLIKLYLKEKIISNLLFPMLGSFSMIFFVIPLSIYQFLNPTKEIREIESHKRHLYFTRINETIDLVVERNKNHKKLFLLSVAGFLTVFILSISSSNFLILPTKNFITTQPLLCFVATWVLLYLTFKIPLHRHHITALAIMFIDTTKYYLCSFFEIDTMINELFDNWGVFVGLLIIIVICISLRETIEKYLMEISFVSPLFILLTEGSLSLIVYIAYFVIIQFFSCSPDQGFFEQMCFYSRWHFFKQDFVFLFNYSSINSLHAWLLVLVSFSMNFFRITTNRVLSPTHRYVSEIALIFYWVIFIIVRDTMNDQAYFAKYLGLIVDLIVLIFACLLYNEEIIIYLWKLDVNTRKGIELRSSFESQLIMLREIDNSLVI